MNEAKEPADMECTSREMRAIAREIFQHALEESGIERGFSRNLYYERGILQVCDDLYDLDVFSKLFVVCFGKGAHSSLEALMARLGAGTGASGIVSAPTLPPRRCPVSAISGRPSDAEPRIGARRRGHDSRARIAP